MKQGSTRGNGETIMRKIALCLAVVLFATAFAACTVIRTGSGLAEEEVQALAGAELLEDAAPIIADPQRAVEAIHESLENARVDRVDIENLDEVFGIAPYMVMDAVAYVSDAIGGLCDVVIVYPVPGMTDQVREALNQYKTLRADSFRNLDILNSYYIASNAIVFEQGDFVVMLMLPDNTAGREIIDLYLPAS